MPLEAENLNNRNKKKVPHFLFFLCLCTAMSAGLMAFVGVDAFDAQIRNREEVGLGEQIEIDFNQPIITINSDNIAISPAVGFSYKLSDDRKSLVIVPANSLSPEKKYVITLNGLRGISGVMDNKQIIFYTESNNVGSAVLPISSDAADEQQFGEIRLASSRYATPESSAVKEDFHAEPHILEGKYIDVSVSHQVMTLFQDGREVNQFLVSTGKLGMETPRGQFAIKTKETNHWSYQYKLWMPYSMNFYGPIYIHELPYWPNGYREGENHLGKKVSHGCIRLGIGPAEYVFNWAEIGTPVYIHE